MRLRLACMALLATSGAAGQELWDRQWIEVRSDHFVVASALSEQETVDLATSLEHFRLAIDLLTGAAAVPEPISTTIYILPSAVRGLGFSGDIGGYFRPGMRANHAVMVGYGEISEEILKHEYTHYLSRNRDHRLYPPWLEEGLADLLSTLDVAGTSLEYGRVVAGRARTLFSASWLPYGLVLERKVGFGSSDDAARFYAQAWLLVHYLMIGRRDHDFARETADFLRRLEAREAPVDAFKASYGLAVDSLRPQLEEYARAMRFWRMQLTTPFPAPRFVTRAIPADEIAAQFGFLAQLVGYHRDARKYYEASLRANPANTSALVGMARDLQREPGRRWEAAQRLYERALELEPDDDEHHLDYGEFFLYQVPYERKAAARRQLLVEARRRFARAYELNPDNPETLAQNGRTYLVDGEDVMKAVESLEQAHALLPAQQDIQLLLARAYVAAGASASARELLEGMFAVSHGRQVRQIEKLLEDLDSPPVKGVPEVTSSGLDQDDSD